MTAAPARAMVKKLVGSVAASGACAAHVQKIFRSRVNVVYYHFVGGATPYYDSFYQGTTLQRLDDDLTVLGEYFEFAPLDRVVAERDTIGASTPLLAVTFDDGFDLLGNGAADVLEAHGVSATSFLITSCIDNANLMWRNKLSVLRSVVGETQLVESFNAVVRLRGLGEVGSAAAMMRSSAPWPANQKEDLVDELWSSCGLKPLAEFLDEHRPYFTTDGIRAWLDRGHTIGLHTRTHPRCDTLDEAAIGREIVEPAAELKETYDLPALSFSYPFGARLSGQTEEELYHRGVFDAALGIAGCARKGSRPYRLERASGEDGLDFSVFGRTLLGRP